MPQEIIIEPGTLGCINLHGINPEKFTKIQRYYSNPLDGPNHGTGFVHVRRNPLNHQEFILLDGHTRAGVAYTRGEMVDALLWEEGEQITDSLVCLNYARARRLHQTAAICGVGTIQEAISKVTS